MLFGTRNMLKQARHYNIDLNNESLHYVKDFNYLGIKLDCNLDYELHATECYRMVAYKLYLLTRIRKYINIEQAMYVFIAVRYYHILTMVISSITIHSKESFTNYKYYRTEH